MTYTYMWEYIVKDEALAAFEHAYNPEGIWANLFKNAEGYLATELHRDLEHERRFITVDYWASKAAYDQFIAHYAERYQEIDAYCEAFTVAEKLLGTFSCLRSE